MKVRITLPVPSVPRLIKVMAHDDIFENVSDAVVQYCKEHLVRGFRTNEGLVSGMMIHYDKSNFNYLEVAESIKAALVDAGIEADEIEVDPQQ